MKEFLELLAKYVSGEQPFSVVEEWLAGVNWDDPSLSAEEKEAFSLFELLTTEVSEGMRDQQDLVSESTALLTKQRQNVFVKDIRAEVVIRAGAVDTSAITTITIEGGREQRTWSISPQLVT